MTLEEIVKKFLESYDPNKENYFNSDDPWDWDFGGNMSDGLEHGREAGFWEAQQDLQKMLNDNNITL